MIKRVLNAKEAMQYLGLGRRQFEAAVKQGDISFKTIGSKRFYPVWVLEKWLSNTVNHIDYTKEATSITPISRVSLTDKGCKLEKLAEQVMKSWQPNTASRDYRKYNNRSKTSHQVDCLA